MILTSWAKNLEQQEQANTSRAPTAAGTTGICAAVSGALIVNGAAVAVVTSMDFTVERGLEAANVVGSNFAANVFTGRIKANREYVCILPRRCIP